MPNKQQHVFPIILDAVAVSGVSSGAIPITTSFVKVAPSSADTDFTVADGTILGQVLTILNNSGSGHDANITITTAVDNQANLVRLDDPGAQTTLVWTTNGWFVLAGETATATE